MAVAADFQPGCSGFFIVALTICFFKLISKFSAHLITIPPGVIRGYGDEFRIFRFRNLNISFFHASVTGTWSLACAIIYGKEMRDDMVLFVNWPTYALCCFTSGYFLYDALDIIAAKRIIEKWDILLHHLAILISASYVVSYAQCVGYQSVGMLVEVNTFFLHRRQLFQLTGASRDDPPVRRNMYANLLTFVIFRIIPLAYLTYGIFFDGYRVPVWYIRFYATCMALLNIINAILLYRLLRADVIPRRQPSSNSNKQCGHKKMDSVAECCGGLNVDNNNCANTSTSMNKTADVNAENASPVDSSMNANQVNGLHFRNKVLKDMTQLNDGVQRTLTLTP